MIRLAPFALLCLSLAHACAAPPAESRPTSLQLLLAEYPEQDVAVAYMDLESDRQWTINGDEVFHAASTMKIAVLIELYRMQADGELDFDTELVVENEFASIVDGSPYSLTQADDGDQELYAHVGGILPVRVLEVQMIVRSSNLATNLLVELAGADNIQRTIEGLGTTRMRVLRGVEDVVAYRAGLSNTTTARDLMVLMAAIGNGEAVSPAACEAMTMILEAQEFNDLIPAGLPAGTRVAHKTGMITGIRHDAAIVRPAGQAPYVLVVLTRGFEDPEDSAEVIREVTRRVHESHLRGE